MSHPAMWPAALRSKLRPPPRRAVLVRRARLVARLDEGVQRPLTLVSAPAGFGKTTLAAEAAGLRWAWLSLDDDDSDRPEAISAPVELLPPGMLEVGVKTIGGGDLYCLTFRKPG